MDLKALRDTPPWDWPKDTPKILLEILRDDQSAGPDRLLAAELAGDFTVISDDLAGTLLSILGRGDLPEALRGQAAISLGPVLEYVDTEGFDNIHALPIAEATFQRIQESLHQLYSAAGVPKDVRRRILEASVRAPRDWHPEAIRNAYASDDDTWKLTAVFCMCYVRGFADQILDALDSLNADIHHEAVIAAGNWEVDAAWPHVVALATSEWTDKPLRLAAIDAVASIRPHDAADVLSELADSDDEDIVDAVDEALAMAEGFLGEDDEDDDKDEVIH